MQTSLRRRHRDRVVRRGLALIIESDFVRPCLKSMPGGLLLTRASLPHAYPLTLLTCAAQYATDAGRQHFADQLTSIRYWSGGHALNPAYLAHTHTNIHTCVVLTPPVPAAAQRPGDVQL